MIYKLLMLLLLVSVSVSAQTTVPPDSIPVDTLPPPPAPATSLQAEDTDNDHGHSITLHWEQSTDDGRGMNSVVGYEVYRWEPVIYDSLRAIRSQISAAAAAATTFPRALEEAKRALKNLKENKADPASLGFQVAVPTDDSLFQLSSGYVLQKLEDTISFMEAKTPRLTDSLYALRSQLGEAIDRLAPAHSTYPNNGNWKSVGKVGAGTTTFVNSGSKEPNSPDFIPDYSDLYYRVDAFAANEMVRAGSVVAGPVQSKGQWFNTGRGPVFVGVIFFAILTGLMVRVARSGAELYVRPLAGIEAVDDAIGRATEMGRPILYVLGLGTASDVATIASFTILGRVAKRVAEYQTPLMVPTYDPIVMSVAQEVVKSSYLDAGRPDDYDEKTVHFVTNLQFAYVAAVNGMMLRELPATNVYMGKFFAESLILAETGALAGSIQIAGTDEIAQIPFFIVACDYTLIGEELYAASAYLGREPILLGSLKAQDWAKAAIIVLAIAGLVAANFGWTGFTDLFHVEN